MPEKNTPGTLRPKPEGIRPDGATLTCVNLYRPGGSGPLRPVLPDILAGGSDAPSTAAGPVTHSPCSLPAVRLYAVAMGPMQQRVEQSVLKADASSPRGTVHPTADSLERYSRLLDGAYEQMWGRALGAGLFVQPVLAAYRLLDGCGRELFRSAPQAVALPDAWQCTEPVETTASLSSDGSELTLGALTLSADTFELRADLPDFTATTVKAVELLLSPQLHAVEPGAVCALRVSGNSAQTFAAAVAMPGATASFGSLERMRTLHTRLLAERGSGVLTIAAHAVAAPATVTVPPIPAAGVAEEMRRVASLAVAATTDPGEAARLLRECSAPAGFTARRVLESGDTVVYASVTPLPWSGPDPAELLLPPAPQAVAPAMTRARARVIVTGADGSVIAIRSVEVDVPAEGPLTIVPLVSYPLPRAALMRLEVRRAGSVLVAERELGPSASLTCATAITDGIRPQQLHEGVELGVTAPEAAAEQPGMALVARASAPATPLGAMELCAGSVEWMAAADRTAAAWDASHCRFYAASPGGIYAATATASGQCGSTLIAPGPAPCACSSAGVLLLARGAAIHELRAGSLKLRAVMPGTVTALTPAGADGSVTATLAGGRRLLLSPDMSEWWELDATAQAVEWSAAMTLAPGVRPVALWLDVSASAMEGRVELLSAAGEQLLRLDISGPVRRPVYIRAIEAPHRARLILRLNGSVAPDFRMRAAAITATASSHD